MHSSEKVSTGSRRTSNPSSLYCSLISDRRGSSVVNRFSHPSCLSFSSLLILSTLSTLTPTLVRQGRGGKDTSFFSSSSLVIFLSASNPPKPPFLKGELRGIIIPNSAICNPHSEEVFHLLIYFWHLSKLDDVMLKHFAFPFGEHLVFYEHEKTGFLIELQLICELLL